MKVKDVLEPSGVITVPYRATHEEAARILYTHKVSGAPVVNENGEIIGLISEKDLFKALYPSYKKYLENPEFYLDYEARESNFHDVRAENIGAFMAKNVVTVTPNTPILRAGAIMLARGIHRLPVVENKKLVGIVTREQIYRAILKPHLGPS